jgi:TRAP-type C4-dicarboxylate transport system substrate-binding protein
MDNKILMRLTSVAAGAAVALGLSSAAFAQKSQEKRVATLAPEGSAWMKVLGRGAEELSQATGGRVVIKYYAGGVQGDEPDVVAKMQLGQLEGGAFTSIGLSLIEPSIRVLELPALFRTVEEMDYVRKKMWPTFQARFTKKGYHLGEPGDVGFLYFYSAKPVKAMSDLSSAKVWLWGQDKIVKSMFKKLGVNGVPMGPPDVLPALNTGKISACYGSPLAMVVMQWYTKVKYATSMPMAYGIGATVFMAAAWDSISAEDKATSEKVLKIQAQKLRKAVRKDNARALKTITHAGVQVIESPAAMVGDFEAKAQATWNELAGSVYSKDDLAKVLKYRDEFRSKNAAK